MLGLFQRLSQLPPYVFARIDEVKAGLRAKGQDVFDFGLGNPDGRSPESVVARLSQELAAPNMQRYMPSPGLPETRQAICDWYQRRYDIGFDAMTESCVSIGSKEGIAHLLLAIVGQGDHVLVPDPGYPIHRYGVVIAGGQPVSVATGPDRDPLLEIERVGISAGQTERPYCQFSTQPSTAVVDVSFYEKIVALAEREDLWVISDLAYADLCFDDPGPPAFSKQRARVTAP